MSASIGIDSTICIIYQCLSCLATSTMATILFWRYSINSTWLKRNFLAEKGNEIQEGVARSVLSPRPIFC